MLSRRAASICACTLSPVLGEPARELARVHAHARGGFLHIGHAHLAALPRDSARVGHLPPALGIKGALVQRQRVAAHAQYLGGAALWLARIAHKRRGGQGRKLGHAFGAVELFGVSTALFCGVHLFFKRLFIHRCAALGGGFFGHF